MNRCLDANNFNLWIRILFNDYLTQWFAYLLVVLAGVRLIYRKEFCFWLLGLGTAILLIFQLNIDLFCPNNYKYPPHPYYIGYGFFASMLLWIITPNIHLKVIEWFSKNSWNIYIAHIVFYVLTVFVHPWFVRYILILSGSIVAVVLLPKIKQLVFDIFSRHRIP